MKTNESALKQMLEDEGMDLYPVCVSDLGVKLEGETITHVIAETDHVQLWGGDPSGKHSLCWVSRNFKDEDTRFEDACAEILKLY